MRILKLMKAVHLSGHDKLISQFIFGESQHSSVDLLNQLLSIEFDMRLQNMLNKLIRILQKEVLQLQNPAQDQIDIAKLQQYKDATKSYQDKLNKLSHEYHNAMKEYDNNAIVRSNDQNSIKKVIQRPQSQIATRRPVSKYRENLLAKGSTMRQPSQLKSTLKQLNKTIQPIATSFKSNQQINNQSMKPSSKNLRNTSPKLSGDPQQSRSSSVPRPINSRTINNNTSHANNQSLINHSSTTEKSQSNLNNTSNGDHFTTINIKTPTKRAQSSYKVRNKIKLFNPILKNNDSQQQPLKSSSSIERNENSNDYSIVNKVNYASMQLNYENFQKSGLGDQFIKYDSKKYFQMKSSNTDNMNSKQNFSDQNSNNLEIYTVNYQNPSRLASENAKNQRFSSNQTTKIENLRKLINKPKGSISPIQEEKLMSPKIKNNNQIINSRQNINDQTKSSFNALNLEKQSSSIDQPINIRLVRPHTSQGRINTNKQGNATFISSFGRNRNDLDDSNIHQFQTQGFQTTMNNNPHGSSIRSLFPRSQANNNVHDSLIMGSTFSNLNETPHNLLFGSIMGGQSTMNQSQNNQQNLEYKLKLLAPLPPIPYESVKETEICIVQKYLEINLNDKNLSESKILRHQLGIGMPEATGIVKVTGQKTLTELIMWYLIDINKSLTDQEIIENITTKNKMLQFSIASPSRTVRFIAIISRLAFDVEIVRKEVLQQRFIGDIKLFNRVRSLIYSNF